MNRKIGFTLIELLITITIVVVLLTLTVVSLRSSQAVARDEERKTDVAIIAQNLENYYRSGLVSHKPAASLASTKLAAAGDPYNAGQYPPTVYMNSETEIKYTLGDLDPTALRAPGVADNQPISLVTATNASEPSPDINTYVYQPLRGDGSLCTAPTHECRRFTLYYKLETEDAVQKITSRNQ